MKGLLRLAFVILIANAGWHLFTAYSAHYKFRDSVQDASQFGESMSEQQLQQKVLDLAAQYDVPQDAEGFTIHRDDTRTSIDGAYTRAIELVPSFQYPWRFAWHVDTLSVKNRESTTKVPAGLLPPR